MTGAGTTLDAGGVGRGRRARPGDRARAADLSGIARESLTRTVQYDKDRVQFGRPVGSFQAIKHTSPTCTSP